MGISYFEIKKEDGLNQIETKKATKIPKILWWPASHSNYSRKETVIVLGDDLIWCKSNGLSFGQHTFYELCWNMGFSGIKVKKDPGVNEKKIR